MPVYPAPSDPPPALLPPGGPAQRPAPIELEPQASLLEPVPTAVPLPQAALPEPAVSGAPATLAELEAALEAHRRAVFDAVMTTPQALLAGQLIFECTLLGSTRPGRRPALARLEERAQAAAFDVYGFVLPGDPGHSLAAILEGEGRAPVEVGPAMGALFALGFQATLGQRGLSARRNLTARLVAALPALERWSRAQVADYVHLACRPEDDARFWAVYLERVVIEVNARASAPRGPWLLPHLLARESRGIDPVPNPAWATLKRHVDRLLHAPTGRGRWAQALVERCHDVDMLHAVAQTPAVVDDPAVVERLLLDGSPAAVSCAVFALQQGRGGDAVERVLRAGYDRPFPDVVGALAEMHAQAALVERPEPAVARLSQGVVDIVGKRAAGYALDGLLQTVRADPRSLRTSLLPVAAAEHPGLAGRAQAVQLRQRVLSTWLSIYTPAGIAHPLNDQQYREAIAENLASLVRGDHRAWRPVDQLIATLADRAAGFAAEADARTRLLGRFCGALGDVLRRCDRHLAHWGADEADRNRVHARLVQCWRLDPGAGAGWLGPGERALATLFVDLRGGEAVPAERVAQAAQQLLALARVPQAPVEPRAALPAQADPAPALEPFGADAAPRVRLSRRFAAACQISRGPQRGWLDAVGGYLAWPMLDELPRAVGHILGWSDEAEVVLEEERLTVRRRQARGEAGREVSLTLTTGALERVEVQRGAWLFPASLGAAGLLAGGLVGGALLYTGLRTQSTLWAAAGGALLLGSAVFDVALTAAARLRRNNLSLTLGLESGQKTTLWLAPEQGSALLDELMNRQAERAEIAARGAFVEAESGVAEEGWAG